MYCTFDMFDLFISSHPHILRFLCTCLYPCILASLYPYVRVYLLVSSHPHILRFMCLHLHPCILISSGLCVLACILVSSYPLILRLMYCGYVLVSSHPHILIGSCTPGACWYPRILTSSYP